MSNTCLSLYRKSYSLVCINVNNPSKLSLDLKILDIFYKRVCKTSKLSYPSTFKLTKMKSERRRDNSSLGWILVNEYSKSSERGGADVVNELFLEANSD
jgi:hypothetical protein